MRSKARVWITSLRVLDGAAYGWNLQSPTSGQVCMLSDATWQLFATMATVANCLSILPSFFNSGNPMEHRELVFAAKACV